MRPPPGERGAALLAVLMLVAIMAGLAAMALDRLRLATRIAANGAGIEQARFLALAAEQVAVARIAALRRAAGDRADPGGWQGRRVGLPLPAGLAAARLTDGGNCFNLNSVVSGATTGPDIRFVTRPTGLAQFTALMEGLGIGAAEARRAADALADWIDTDDYPRALGAEDAAYLALPVPHRTAGTILADPSELAAIAGIGPALYQRLKPWVCTLPVTDLSPINVNTLTPEQVPLLTMLSPEQMPPARARALIARRPAGGWESVAAFWNDAGRLGAEAPADVQAQPRVQTRWFALDVAVTVGGADFAERALIDAAGNPARIVARRWGDGQ
jgi:general secretion pathway protein K